MVRDAARDVGDVVVRDDEVHPLFGRAIIESDELITATTVTAEGDFHGKTPGALELEERTGMTATAARRSGDWLRSHRRDNAPGGRRARREGAPRGHAIPAGADAGLTTSDGGLSGRDRQRRRPPGG